MKKVKMLVSMAGPDESYQPGDDREVSAEVAEEWQAVGIATIVGDTISPVSAEEHEAAYKERLNRMSNDELKMHAKARFDVIIKGRKSSLIKQILEMGGE